MEGFCGKEGLRHPVTERKQGHKWKRPGGRRSNQSNMADMVEDHIPQDLDLSSLGATKGLSRYVIS